MTALAKNTPRTEVNIGHRFVDPVAAAVRIFNGAMVALNAAGNAVPAAPTAAVIRGVALEEADNRLGAAGETSVRVKRGVWLMANDGSVNRTHIGDPVYVVDDNTVGADDEDTILAGKCLDVTPEGVVVEIL